MRPTAPAIAPDPNALLAMQMRAVLARFVAWSRDHAGAPCPDGAALGVVALDPWGHAIELTCTDQPADQRIGAISAGADGITGNGDDVVSWALGHGVTDPVRGPRWKPAPAETTAPPATQTSTIQHGKDRTGTHDRRSAAFPAAPRAPSKPGAPPSDGGTDDIPAHR